MFTDPTGKAWNKDSWKHPIKAAVRAAELPDHASAYTLRHSVITDLVIGGLDLLTVANVVGKSIKMIDKHYGQYQPGAALTALAGLTI